MSTTTKSILSAVAVLCFLEYGTLAADLGEQWVYLYQANTTVGNNLTNEVVSQWSISAKLIINSYKDYKIMKLEDVKTTAYNGLSNEIPNLPGVEIPTQTSILTEPFIIHYNRNYEKLERFNFLPNEPQWSINMKKAIASVYQVDFANLPTNGDTDENLHEELNIYGKCKLEYKHLSSNTTITVQKNIKTNNCVMENTPRYNWENIDLGNFAGEISRYYTYNKLVSDSTSPVKSITSNAQFRYWLLTSDRNFHYIDQTQQFDFVSSSPLTKKSDNSPYTLKKLPIYEFENTLRQVEPESKETNLKNALIKFIALKEQINDNKSYDLNEEIFNSVDTILKSLSTMDLETLKLEDFRQDSQVFNMFSSILPYVGTEASVELIKEIIQNNTQIDLNELRMLAFFPLYVNSPNDRMLSTMEKLLDMELKGVSETVKQTYILSFSNLVYQMYNGKLGGTNNPLTAKAFYKNFAKKFVQKYYDYYTASNDYSVKMKYVLGMMNMGEAASPYLLSIIQNTTETRHIRALAIYSIKPSMIYRKREAYQLFWPLVRNDSEPFQIRTAALSLLLSSNINSSELYSILRYMNETSYDGAKQHLHNYFYTAILSGQTDCDFCTMKELAQTMLLDLQPPETNQGLMTSYHQVSYTDDQNNFETSLNVHIVANPVTNFVNVFQVTLNHFTGQHKTGEYSIYVKAEGISSKLYKEEYERYFPVKELYKILQEIKLGVLEGVNENLHIELIVYVEQRAIFALFINGDNVDEMADYIDKIIIYIGNNDIITMRDVRNLHFVSDLGTPIHTTLKYEHVLGSQFKNYDKIFLDLIPTLDGDDENYVLTRVRSMWISKLNFQSYNPLTNLNHGVSKIFSNQNLIKFKIDYNVYELSIKMNDDTSYFDTLLDHKYAVFADNNDILQTFCAKCNSVAFLSTQSKTTEKQLNLWLWIKDIKIKQINCTNPRFERPIHEIIQKSRVSYRGLPFAQPFVLLAYICDYSYYIPQYDICTTSINSERIVKEPNLSTLKITFINDALDENYKLNLNFNITLALIQRAIQSKKLLNQWNLNIQRQELEKGVYYELHYDDNAKTVKFDVHSDLEYLPTSPDTDMFSLRPAEPIISRTSVLLQENNASPAMMEITSLFSVSSEQIEMVNRSKTFELCQKDYQKDYVKDLLLKHTPPTKSCYNASLGFSTYDDYAIYVEFKNISQKLQRTLEEDILKPLKNIGSLDKQVVTDSFNASIIYKALPSTFNIDVGESHIVANYSVPELLRPRALLKPTSRFIEELRYQAFGLDNVCIIIPRYVITFTGKIVEHDSDISIIPLIECTNTTRLGLTTNMFTYKLWSDENTFQLGKKEGGYYVMRNGKYLKKHVRAEDYSVNFVNDNTFHIITSRIELYYNGEYLTVRIRSAFLDRMCGMCVSGKVETPVMGKYFT